MIPIWYCNSQVESGLCVARARLCCGCVVIAGLCCSIFLVLFSVCFAGIYREGLRLWPSVCCRKFAFWIEMGKLVPDFMLWMRLRRLDRMGGARNSGFSLNLDHIRTKINKRIKTKKKNKVL